VADQLNTVDESEGSTSEQGSDAVQQLASTTTEDEDANSEQVDSESTDNTDDAVVYVYSVPSRA
jgi:hypothetical protein